MPGTKMDDSKSIFDSFSQPSTISVLLDGNKTADLQVEEFHPLEPSNYCYDPGWTCFDLNTDTEYFVSKSGDVFIQPENKSVGIAPEIRKQADEMEAFLDKAFAPWNDDSWL